MVSNFIYSWPNIQEFKANSDRNGSHDLGRAEGFPKVAQCKSYQKMYVRVEFYSLQELMSCENEVSISLQAFLVL